MKTFYHTETKLLNFGVLIGRDFENSQRRKLSDTDKIKVGITDDIKPLFIDFQIH